MGYFVGLDLPLMSGVGRIGIKSHKGELKTQKSAFDLAGRVVGRIIRRSKGNDRSFTVRVDKRVGKNEKQWKHWNITCKIEPGDKDSKLLKASLLKAMK
jgi:hypothetical protein